MGMLLSLSVQDFAIIEDIHIDFKPGMTVLTGETGAGKSLIIDTISLLLGERASSEMIRYGKKKASIVGVFSYENPKIDALLERYGISVEDELTIERQIYDTSKNTIKLNGVSITLSMLKELACLLASIHAQSDTFKLFNPEHYLDVITPVGDKNYDHLYSGYLRAYSHYLEAYKKYQQILKGQKESQEKLDFLCYEQQEIASLNLHVGMDEELRQEVSKLENYDKLYSSMSEAYSKLNNEYFSIDTIYEAKEHLKKIKDLDPLYEEYYNRLNDCYYALEEVENGLSKQVSSLDFDQDELNLKIEQLNDIERIKQKYHKNVKELLDYLDEITLKIEMATHYDDVLTESFDELEKSFEDAVRAGTSLSNYRKELAKSIEAGIVSECKDLDLEETRFEIRFNHPKLDDPLMTQDLTETGIDQIDFMVSFNEGEPLYSLYKVASGGEMSRMMLAFKSFLSKDSKVSLMVFDEIDSGVSGSTAKKIAIKLSQIAKYTQVLCITHLPQVASIGKQHIHIYKEVSNHRTSTHFKYLDMEERIEEVAMMLSGDKLSLYALEHAKSLLTNQE